MTNAEKFAYKYTKAEDGTYTVEAVDIFELGKLRGFNYDEAWAQRALANFERRKAERGYLPTVIIGHTTDDEAVPEKPSIGFMDRLRLVGKTFYVDLVHIAEDVFTELQKGRWPYRSVELFDKAAEFTSLALLGGTPPFFKFAPLTFGNERGEWVMFGVPYEKDENDMADVDITPIPGVTSEQLDALRAELTEKFEAQIQAANDRANKAETEAASKFASVEEERRIERVERLNSDLRERYGLAPGIIEHPATVAIIDHLSRSDKPVKFKHEDKEHEEVGLDIFRVLVQDMAKNKATLFVDRSSTGLVEPADAPGDEKPFDLRVSERRTKLQAENEGLSLYDATVRAKREILAETEVK